MVGASAKQRRKQQRQQLPQNEGPEKKTHQEKKPVSATNKVKKKFQKPKHLKRKLESADEVEKQRLLQELRSFEQLKTTKVPAGNRNKSNAKKQRTTPERAEQNDNINNNDKAEAPAKKWRFERTVSPILEEEVPVVKGKATTSKIENSKKDKKSTGKVKQPEKQSENHEHDQAPPALKDDNTSDPAKEDADHDELPPSSDQPTRTRGKRRRGRKSTSQKVQEQDEQKQEEDEKDEINENDSNDHKKPRYCVGRKPITDYVVGQTYQGTVVYAKPFGVFFDIGCHSDAFCHVSRLRDDFCASPVDEFPPGMVVEKVRIVEIDRRSKRLTASLQSEARRADEEQSMQARAARQEKIAQKKGSKTKKGHKKDEDHDTTGTATTTHSFAMGSAGGDRHPHSDDRNNFVTKPQEFKGGTIASNAAVVADKLESEMTPAELKRHRKLQRRAARRAERGDAGEPTEQ